MNPIFVAALELQTACQEKGWKFCFIGGVAVQRWAEPRFTQDADLTLLTGFGEEEKFIQPLLERFMPRRSAISGESIDLTRFEEAIRKSRSPFTRITPPKGRDKSK